MFHAFSQQELLILFTFATGIVSILELLEFLFTRNIPWLGRLLQKAFRSLNSWFHGRKVSRLRTLIVNFSGHPVLPGQKKAIEKLMHWQGTEVIDVPLGNVPEDRHFVVAIEKAVDSIDISPKEWQELPMVVIPAGYSAVWAIVQSILHGRLGHFPDVVRLRPSSPLSAEKFEVAEIMNLHQVRHQSRDKR